MGWGGNSTMAWQWSLRLSGSYLAKGDLAFIFKLENFTLENNFFLAANFVEFTYIYLTYTPATLHKHLFAQYEILFLVGDVGWGLITMPMDLAVVLKLEKNFFCSNFLMFICIHFNCTPFKVL